MEEEQVKQSGKFVYDFIKDVIDETGPRLPGTPEERRGAEIIGERAQEITGTPSVTERFTLHDRASIGAIPVLGICGLISFALFYLSPIATLVASALCLIFAVVQIFTYKGWFDFLFPKSESQNVYSILPPKDGQPVKYTLMFSGHVDSCWNWNLSLKNPATAIPKIVIGVVGFFVMMIISSVAIALGAYSFKTIAYLASLPALGGREIFMIVLYCLPVITVPGSYWLSEYLTWDKTKASPGAMDNLSGIGIALATVKYLKENPSAQPDGCRVIVAGLGAEEASLKGASAFVNKHKDDGMLDNLYVINLDSFRDDKYFSAVKGDAWLMSRFDRGLVDITKEAMREALGSDATDTCPGEMLNPVGGCDSTPFCRAGVKTVTLCAQKPTLTDYYHTCKDTVEGLSMYSLEKGFLTAINMIPKIDAYHASLGGEK